MLSLQFLLTAFVVVIAPGTGVIYTLAIGLGQGRWPSIWAAFGCTVGIVPHLLAATLGLAAVLHTSAVLFNVVKFAGVAYLLWLAYQSLRSGGALAVSANRSAESGVRIARRGALINILNPKLSIFFLALLPPFLTGNPATGDDGNGANGRRFYGDDLCGVCPLRRVCGGCAHMALGQ